jgi:hypothetical protein
MSTPSFIGILYADKHVELVYCHFDSYPVNGAGSNLIKHYNSFKEAQKIVALGSRDCLVPSKKSKVRFYGDEAIVFNNWDSVIEYMKKRPDIFWIYIWNELVSRWEFIESKNLNLTNLHNLQEFLKLGE